MHRLNLLAALKGHQPPPKDAKAQSHLERLFRQLYAALRRRALVIVLSDFIDHSGQDAKTWSEALRQLRSRHDVVAVKINDPSDWELPERGYFLAEDAESGEQLWVDADDPGFRARFADAVRQEQLDLQQWLRQSGARLMQISHQDDALRALSRWMRRRS
ncbi:MAG: hypothetical protein EBZ03_03275 [Betaproteobacteria bacterium]|nr:hypothetical protein [Betaproteobacteria bacterium]